MPKRESPKLNRDNFVTWKSLMKMHLGSIGDHAQTKITVEHVDPAGVPTVEDMKKKKEHNQAMIEIAFDLSYVKFDEIKGCKSNTRCGNPCQIFMEEMRMSKEKKEKALKENLMK